MTEPKKKLKIVKKSPKKDISEKKEKKGDLTIEEGCDECETTCALTKSPDKSDKPIKKKKIVIIKTFKGMTMADLIFKTPIEGWESIMSKNYREIETISGLLQKEIDQYNEKNGKDVDWIFFPKKEDLMNAFRLTSFDATKVVILGQSPYEKAGQAHGLSFSVRDGVPIPPSERNMFEELEAEYPDFRRPKSGCLVKWAKQGVLLLNASLVIRNTDKYKSEKKGKDIMSRKFTPLTGDILKRLSTRGKCVFLLWGAYADAYSEFIKTSSTVKILRSSHPSPYSYAKTDTPFKGNGHFLQTNEILEEMGETPIDWNLVDEEEIN